MTSAWGGDASGVLTDDVIATREKTLAAHLDGESRKDVEAVLATFGGEPT